MKTPHIFRERDPTQGSILKTSISWASRLWPNTIFWILINLLSLFWLSKIGIEAIAAVAIGGAAFVCLMAVISGIVISTHGLIGGCNKNDKIGLEKRVKQILSTTWFTSIVLALAGYFLAPPLLNLLGAEPRVTSEAITYLRIQAIFGIISFSFWPLNEMVRATGFMNRGMIFMAIVLAFQGLFDYAFILGNFGLPQMGVAGSSLSRALSAVIGTIAVFWWICSGKWLIKINFKNWQDFKIRWQALKEVFSIAGFNILQNFSGQGVQMVILGIITPFGSIALGAYEIGQRFFRYSNMFGMDLGKGTSIGVANNLAKGLIKRAKNWGWINAAVNTALMAFLGTPLFIFANQIVEIYTHDAEVVNIGVSYFRITVIGYIFLMTGIIFERVFTGAKNTWIPLLAYWLMAGMQIGLAFILPKYFGLGISGIWIALLIGMIFYGLVLTTLFKIGCWKPKTIDTSK